MCLYINDVNQVLKSIRMNPFQWYLDSGRLIHQRGFVMINLNNSEGWAEKYDLFLGQSRLFLDEFTRKRISVAVQNWKKLVIAKTY